MTQQSLYLLGPHFPPSAPTIQMLGMLLRGRLRWYALATGRLLLRRWQALLLVLAILAPAGVSLLTQVQSLAFPILLFTSPEHGPIWRYAYLLTLQALATIWAMMQRDQICGGEYMLYAESLPVARRHRRLVDVLILFVASSPLFLPLVAAAAWFYAQEDTLLAKAVHTFFILDFALLMIVVELAALERMYRTWIVVAAADILIITALVSDSQPVQLTLLGAAPIVAYLLALVLPARLRIFSSKIPRHDLAANPFQISFIHFHPAALISLNFLLKQSLSTLLGKVMVATAIAAATIGLMTVWEYDERAFPMSIIGLAGTALTISSLYRDLNRAHALAATFMDALPLPRKWSDKFDMAMTVSLGLPFGVVIISFALFHQTALSAATAFGVMAAFVALLSFLRLPQVYTERHSVFLSAVTAVLWAVITIFALS
jgi:hypothetical protein